jgi:hypothetical protein
MNLSMNRTNLVRSIIAVAIVILVSPVDNWSKHPGKSQDGRCAPTTEVPFPLPRAVGSKN